MQTQCSQNRKQQLCFFSSCVIMPSYLSCSMVQIYQPTTCLVNLHLVRVLARKFSRVVFVTWAWKMTQHQSLALGLVIDSHIVQVELTCCCRVYFATQWWRWYWAVCTQLSLLCITRACHSSPNKSWGRCREIFCWYSNQLDVKHVLPDFLVASGFLLIRYKHFRWPGRPSCARGNHENHESHVSHNHWDSFHSTRTKHIQLNSSLKSPLLCTPHEVHLLEVYVSPWELCILVLLSSLLFTLEYLLSRSLTRSFVAYIYRFKAY